MIVVTSRWSIGGSNAANGRASRAFAQGALQGVFDSTSVHGESRSPVVHQALRPGVRGPEGLAYPSMSRIWVVCEPVSNSKG